MSFSYQTFQTPAHVRSVLVLAIDSLSVLHWVCVAKQRFTALHAPFETDLKLVRNTKNRLFQIFP